MADEDETVSREEQLLRLRLAAKAAHAPGGQEEKVVVRLLAPLERIGAPGWTCRFEIGEPISYSLDVAGESSLQAVVLALKGLAACLYGSDEYRTGKLGLYGEFGGSLGIPAPKNFLDEAPYPF